LVLDKIIDEKQRAFMGGRNMLDNMLVANEEVDDAKRRKRSCLIFKVVFEKAYNCVC